VVAEQEYDVNSPKVAPNPQVAQNSVRACCLAPLAMQLVFFDAVDFGKGAAGLAVNDPSPNTRKVFSLAFVKRLKNQNLA